MTRYAAFLRGINVGSANRIPMAALRAAVAGLGYTDVSTYINSGNVMFSVAGDGVAGESQQASAISQAISQAVADAFGFSVDVAARTREQLGQILAENPFPDGDPSRVTVAFLTSPAPESARERLAAVADVPFRLGDTEVWVNYLDGQAGSKLAAEFSRIVGVSSTVRNVRTVAKVLERMS